MTNFGGKSQDLGKPKEPWGVRACRRPLTPPPYPPQHGRSWRRRGGSRRGCATPCTSTTPSCRTWQVEPPRTPPGPPRPPWGGTETPGLPPRFPPPILSVSGAFLASPAQLCWKMADSRRCSAGWKVFEKSCYFFSSGTLSWPEAKETCTDHGAHLVIIDSEQEQVGSEKPPVSRLRPPNPPPFFGRIPTLANAGARTSLGFGLKSTPAGHGARCWRWGRSTRRCGPSTPSSANVLF